MNPVTHERLLEVLHYEPETGVFTRKVSAGGCVSGSVAGCIDKSEGYFRITIDRRQYWSHRLAWFYTHGVWPAHDIDHIDRNRGNNRLANLRAVTRAENLQNQCKAGASSKSGIRGVSWDKGKRKWKAEISIGNRNKFIGRFDDINAAAAAYLSAKRIHHPGSLV